MRTRVLSVGIALCAAGCLRPPSDPATPLTPPTLRSHPPTHNPPPTTPTPAEPMQPFGLGPDAVVVIEWGGKRDQQHGEAYVVLPSGERLVGPWSAMDSNLRRETPAGTTGAQHPNEDPGDPTSMPSGRSPATIVVIELRGNRGTRMTCTIPVGARSKSKTGKCHGADTRYFLARMR